MLRFAKLCAAAILCMSSISPAAEPTREEAVVAMQRAVDFFRTQCAVQGGYVFRWSDDLSLREGEARVGNTTAWIEPPATPAVGSAYLNAYQLTRIEDLLEAARETAGALIHGQLMSGGWGEQIEFAQDDRQLYAYRVDGAEVGKRRNITTFDDDKTQSAIRFLIQLDKQLEQTRSPGDAQLHEAAQFALQGVLAAQYANGAWPQKFDGNVPADAVAAVPASFPESWSREFPDEKYSSFYTLNDGTHCDLIDTLLVAWDAYGDSRYLQAAKQGGEFLLLAQLPPPQPGWAQQYNQQMHPCWARKFEPPAISGGESQHVMRTLLTLYQRTADARFLDAVRRALPYYAKSILPNGKLARFYEMGTNRPLYFTKTYELTYSDSDLPTHYAFMVSSGLDRIERELQRLQNIPSNQLERRSSASRPAKLTEQLKQDAASVIAALDARGAWVEPGTLKTHSGQATHIIASSTFIENLETLATYISAIGN